MSDFMGCHMYDENTDEIIKPARDVFEINDFTAASDWERFIDSIENILRKWKINNVKNNSRQLEKGDFSKYNWKCKSENLVFHDFLFTVTHYELNLPKLEEDATVTSDEETFRKG